MRDKDKIEKEILSRGGPWVFDEKVSDIFEEHVRKSIPCYDIIQRLIGLLSRKILKKQSLVYDLGTATGEVIFNIHQYNETLDIRFIGIDNSMAMLKKAKQKCNQIENVQFTHKHIGEVDYQPADLFVSAFTMQFVEMGKRKDILKRIHESLNKDASLIICEKVCCKNAKQNDLYQQLYEEWKLNYFTPDEIVLKRASLSSVMKPISIPENIKLLQSAGFDRIESFFQWCNFICFIAR